MNFQVKDSALLETLASDILIVGEFYSKTIILWHQQSWIKWLSVFWAFKIMAVNPKTHCTLSPTTNKQKKHHYCSHNIGILGKKESSSNRLRVMTQLSLVVCMFPFKYSLAALLENDYLQNASQMIFKFQKEFCTLWSTVKNIYIHYSLLTSPCSFPLSSTPPF